MLLRCLLVTDIPRPQALPHTHNGCWLGCESAQRVAHGGAKSAILDCLVFFLLVSFERVYQRFPSCCSRIFYTASILPKVSTHSRQSYRETNLGDATLSRGDASDFDDAVVFFVCLELSRLREDSRLSTSISLANLFAGGSCRLTLLRRQRST